MSKVPSVCIMIPTYNQAAYITKAVESAIAQNYPNLEIVVADDCSTDNTAEILKPYIINNQIRYIKNEKNLGRVGNYKNSLYNNILTDWVINLDGDDYYTNPNYISLAMETIEKYGKENILFYQGFHTYENGNIQKSKSFRRSEEQDGNMVLTGKSYFFRYTKFQHFSHMSTIYNRQLAIESGFYEIDVLSTDIYSILKLCINNASKNVILSRNVSGTWLQHENNASKKLSMTTHFKNSKIFKKLYSYAINRGFDKSSCNRWLKESLYIYFRIYLGLIYRKITKK